MLSVPDTDQQQNTITYSRGGPEVPVN